MTTEQLLEQKQARNNVSWAQVQIAGISKFLPKSGKDEKQPQTRDHQLIKTQEVETGVLLIGRLLC